MDLFINGIKIDAQIENEKTLQEVLSYFEEEGIKNNATIVKIIVNGKEISAEELDSEFGKPLTEIETLEISTICENDIVTAMKNFAIQLSTVCTGLEQIPINLQTNQDAQVNTVISSFANSFDTLCHLISLTALFPERFDAFRIDEMDINQYLKDFSPMLKEFENALKDKDTVLIGDLAEYEIMPRLTKLIASIKEM
ncbi:MAG: hypothetical protein BKP49_00920 [Treponema sp. CETP13]|nr:MAG: hypothetical protein BKP49_00920 [Treponema sp. CETP13]